MAMAAMAMALREGTLGGHSGREGTPGEGTPGGRARRPSRRAGGHAGRAGGHAGRAHRAGGHTPRERHAGPEGTPGGHPAGGRVGPHAAALAGGLAGAACVEVRASQPLRDRNEQLRAFRNTNLKVFLKAHP